MGVDDARHVFGGALELHRHHAFGDQLGHARADHFHAENAIGIGVGHHLDHTDGLVQATARPMAAKGKLPTLYGVPSSLSCFSVLPTQAISGSV